MLCPYLKRSQGQKKDVHGNEKEKYYNCTIQTLWKRSLYGIFTSLTIRGL